MHETLDLERLGGLEHYVRSHDVVCREFERIAKRVVNVRMSREVENSVDFLFA
jgi:hypothetical protein